MDANRFDRLDPDRWRADHSPQHVQGAAGEHAGCAWHGRAWSRRRSGRTLVSRRGFEGDSLRSTAGTAAVVCRCDTTLTNPRCEYKRNCGGKKGDACKNDGRVLQQQEPDLREPEVQAEQEEQSSNEPSPTHLRTRTSVRATVPMRLNFWGRSYECPQSLSG